HALELSKDHGWVYGDVPAIVMTKRRLPVERKHVELFAGSPELLIAQKLKPHYRNVWLVGGAALTREVLRLGLADEIRQTVLPILLGNGIPFYDLIGKE